MILSAIWPILILVVWVLLLEEPRLWNSKE